MLQDPVLLGGSRLQTAFWTNFCMYFFRLAARFCFFFAFPPVLFFLGCPPPWLLAQWFPSLTFGWDKRKTQLRARSSWHRRPLELCPSAVGRFKFILNVSTGFFLICCICSWTEESVSALWNFWQTFDECLSVCTDKTWAAPEVGLVVSFVMPQEPVVQDF